MEKDDEFLRKQHLSFYADDIEKIDKLLENFLKLSNSKSIYLIDKSGNMITSKGGFHSFNPDELSALVAASFAATKEIARLMGESEFSVMFHQGKTDNIHLSLIGEKAIAATLFGGDTTTGMVSLYSKELSVKLTELFDVICKRGIRKEDLSISDELGSSVGSRLDDLFKE